MSRLRSPQPDPAPAADPSLTEENDVTALDSRTTASPPRSWSNGRGQPAADPAAQAQRAAGASRGPRVRLESLFDPGSLSLRTPQADSGALAPTGSNIGVTAPASATDPRAHGDA